MAFGAGRWTRCGGDQPRAVLPDGVISQGSCAIHPPLLVVPPASSLSHALSTLPAQVQANGLAVWL